MTLEEQIACTVRDAMRAAMPDVLAELRAAAEEVMGRGSNAASRWVTVQEAASMMSVGQSTVRKWLRKGRLRRCGPPDLPRIALAEIVALMDGTEQLPSTAGPSMDRIEQIAERYRATGQGGRARRQRKARAANDG